jgi:AcrR family transcriptional regulator
LEPPEPETPRGRIIQAARYLFADQGLDGTSTRAIAYAAGVNLAMIHYYFGSKEQLYERVLVYEFIAGLRDTSHMPENLRPEEIIFAIPLHLLEIARNNPTWLKLMRREIAGGGVYMTRAMKTMGEYGPIGLRARFDFIYQRAVESGKIRALPPDAVRECLIAMAYGMMFMEPFFKIVLNRDLGDEATYREWKETFGALLRHGLLSEDKNG